MWPTERSAPPGTRLFRTLNLIALGLAMALSGCTTAPSRPLPDSITIVPAVEAAAWQEGLNALETGVDAAMRGQGREIYRSKAPSVVLISSGDGIGAGALLDLEGHVLTNWHVIEGRETVGVFFKPPRFEEVDENDQILADVLRYDQVADLALIKLRSLPSGVEPISLGRLDNVEVAMEVHAIGHPIGQVWTYTTGTISQVRPNFEWQTGPRETHRGDVIQTQTPINPGNSGGPLMDDDGLLIGINSFTNTQAQGISFAVAVTEIERFLSESDNRYMAGREPRPGQARPGQARPGQPGKQSKGELAQGGSQQPPSGSGSTSDATIQQFDDDNDGQTDRVVVDRNGNGRPDLEVKSDQYKGRDVFMWMFDDDEDGTPERVGIDLDGDGEPDIMRRG